MILEASEVVAWTARHVTDMSANHVEQEWRRISIESWHMEQGVGVLGSWSCGPAPHQLWAGKGRHPPRWDKKTSFLV